MLGTTEDKFGMRDELEPEDDELNPTSPRHGSIDNGKLGTESDKLEPRNELGTDELETEAEIDPTNGKLVPSAPRPHSFTKKEPEAAAGDELGATMNEFGATGEELRATVDELGAAVGKLGTSGGEFGAAIDELMTSRGELGAAINGFKATGDELGSAVDELGSAVDELGTTEDKIGTSSDELFSSPAPSSTSSASFNELRTTIDELFSSSTLPSNELSLFSPHHRPRPNNPSFKRAQPFFPTPQTTSRPSRRARTTHKTQADLHTFSTVKKKEEKSNEKKLADLKTSSSRPHTLKFIITNDQVHDKQNQICFLSFF
ncbi:hypothetical protein F2Q69_00041923 [Brassica cretica]|uniref:Uncharacterized protein n=1 Tax=Brassica cretica TaxID=69181 RepID=A0A8S9NFH7_BRACR|nr:hypothetical protein F2Q69_00041923 [Brassica cretica]